MASMTYTPGEHLAEMNHTLALAQTNLRRAFSALQKYEEAMGFQTEEKKKPSIRCLAVWQKWLAENGPNTRQVITEETNVKLTERATPHTVQWDYEDIDPTDDSAYPDDMLFRIRAPRREGGRGASPVVYFLWSQRWDIHPLFGVGPLQPTNEESVEITDLSSGTVVWPESEWQPEDAMAEPENVRCATMEEWNDLHAPVFDAMVVSESKPSDEVKALLRDTLPEGEIEGPAIASAYSNAVLRSREPQTLLGVIHPPDLTGVEMVGSHNHVPHIYGPLCDIAHCAPA